MNFLTRCLLLLLLLCCAGIASADEALVLRDGDQSYPANRYLGLLEDKAGTLLLKDVLPGPHAPVFTYPNQDSTNVGFTESVYWARLDVVNRHTTISEWLLEFQYPLIDHVELAIVYPDGRIETVRSGDRLPFAFRAMKHRFPMFRVSVPRDQHLTIYLRVRSEGALQIPLMLHSTSALMARDHDEQLLLGVYYGILLAMFIYNTMLYLSVRDRNYLYYSVYVGAWALMQLTLNGLAFEYLWPQSPYWANMSVPVLVGTVICSTALFTGNFLEAKRFHPKLATGFKLFFLYGLVVIVAPFFIRYATAIKLSQAGALAECVFALTAGVLCWKRGGVQARYFMLAWTMLIVGAAMYVMQNSGRIETMFITEYGLQLGSAFEVLLFSFALAHRMKTLQEENFRIQREATENLEVSVKQRTLELDSALSNLSDAHQRLKDLSRIDGLTGVKNRAYFDEKIAIEWQRGMRERNALGILMIDIDHFKRINDTFGHLGGDTCLREVAHMLAFKVHRITDDAFRFGGEEFVVMLPSTDLKGAMHMGEVMRAAIESLVIVLNGTTAPITISVGVACMVPAKGQSVDLLIGAADKALYRAKDGGRNRVCGAEPVTEPAPTA
ncbi:MAG: diguanylate cyclase [Pseudomonadota bacterium]